MFGRVILAKQSAMFGRIPTFICSKSRRKNTWLRLFFCPKDLSMFPCPDFHLTIIINIIVPTIKRLSWENLGSVCTWIRPSISLKPGYLTGWKAVDRRGACCLAEISHRSARRGRCRAMRAMGHGDWSMMVKRLEFYPLVNYQFANWKMTIESSWNFPLIAWWFPSSPC